MKYEDFGHMIVDKLKSGGGNLQTELFDLFGCDNLEFIEYVLEHQKSIIALFSIQKLPKNTARRFHHLPRILQWKKKYH